MNTKIVLHSLTVSDPHSTLVICVYSYPPVLERKKILSSLLGEMKYSSLFSMCMSEYQDSLDTHFSELSVQRNHMVDIPIVSVKHWACEPVLPVGFWV